MAGYLREDREAVAEAALFLARQMPDGPDMEEHAPHVVALARVVQRLEDTAEQIEEHLERQAFARRALEHGIGRTA